jgi:hypothetical protein
VKPQHLRSSEGPRWARASLMAALAAVVVGALAVGAWAVRDDDHAVAAATSTTTTSSSTTSTTATTTTTVPPARVATMAFGGDVLIHSGVWSAAATPTGYDFSPMLDPVTPILSGADLALCHLEVTLAREGEGPTGYPRFRAPSALATDLREAGFDGCSVSSNHALDYGESGVVATLTAMDAAGLGHVGTARTPEEDRQVVRYDAGGIAVGHLSYSYGFNGFEPPVGQEWLVDRIDPARILEDAVAVRGAGAEVVVVSLHWGNEYTHDVTAAQQEVADALAAVPGAVDLVVGSHAHVVQPASKVGDVWVLWGMGNMLSNNTPGCCREDVIDGVLYTVTIGDQPDGGVGVTGVQFTPTWNERTGFRVLPAAEALAAGAVDPTLADQLRASFERTSAYVLALGGADLGVRPTRPLP